MPQLDLFTLLFQFKVLFIFFFLFYLCFIVLLLPVIHKILFVRRLFLIFLSNMNLYFRQKYLYFFFYKQCSLFYKILKSNVIINNMFFNNYFYLIFQNIVSEFVFI